MHPILFEIPGLNFPLRSFGLMVVLGFLVGSHFFTKWGLARSADPEGEAAGWQGLPVWVMIGVVLGARAMYVIVEVLQGTETGKGFTGDPLSVLFVWRGGLVMYGGAFGGVLGGWLACRKFGIRIAHATDLGLVPGFLGLAIGRIGCLLVGDDYGRIVDPAHEGLPFPVVVKVPETLPEHSLFGANNAGEVLYCTQIWMHLNALLLFGIGVWLLRRRRYPGQVAATLLFLYSFGRYGIESFRGDSIRGLWFNDTISTSQLISIAVAVCTLVYLIVNRGRREEFPAAEAWGDDSSEAPAAS